MRRDPQFNVRWPADLRDAIKASAAANRRSINSEVLLLIERGMLVPAVEPIEAQQATEGEAA